MSERDIDSVIAEMDVLLDKAISTSDQRGHFTCVYRAVTARVRDGIAAGEFLDNERMHDFDVTFASYYLDAVHAYDAGRPLSAAWKVAFDNASSPILVLQHVLLGMNAHINLDLGVAAARTMPGETIIELEDDFRRINDVLADMIDRMQVAVATVSPWAGIVDRVGGRFDETLTGWSLEYARSRAWNFATLVAQAEDGNGDSMIAERDAVVARLSEAIVRPRRATRWAVAAARRRERGADVATMATALRAGGAPLPAI